MRYCQIDLPIPLCFCGEISLEGSFFVIMHAHECALAIIYNKFSKTALRPGE